MPAVTFRSRVNTWSRRLHRWGAVAVMLPFLVVICTGILLLLKKQIPWVQPPVAAPGVMVLGSSLGMDGVLAAAVAHPSSGIAGWEDVLRLDYKPSDGVIKVIGRAGKEVQVCAAEGIVLQVAERRSDLIESLHDGSWFHSGAKLWVFLPSACVVLGLWVTGAYLFVLPIWARRRGVKRAR